MEFFQPYTDFQLTCDCENKVVDHIANLFRNGKQDGLIFVGNDTNEGLVHELAMLYQRYDVIAKERPIFRSNCPLFMPLHFATKFGNRLDTNIIFYQMEGQIYNLVDKFAVRGGSPIVMDLGLWKESTGLLLTKRINRWDRRIDLMGSTFFICDMGASYFNKSLGILHFLERLNLRIEVKKTCTCMPPDMPDVPDDYRADACHNEFLPNVKLGDYPLYHTSVPTGKHRNTR